MAPTADSVDLKGQKKAKKSNSKDERKHRKDKHERPAAAEASLRNEAKRKHKGGQEGKEHGKKPKKEKKAGAEAEAMGAGAAEVKRGDEKMKRAMEDERFAAARTDPRFRPMRRREAKVALDSRFNGMLTNPMFASSEAPVDKRGRRRKKGAKENPMLHYYLKQEEGDEKEKVKLVQEEEDDEVEEEDEQDGEESSSSDDEEEEEDDDDDECSVGSDIAHYLMARHDDTPMIDKETHRLAVVNMDWDHIKAVDLYMVMTSCIPKGGRVLSVSIYPSEFGLKCMNIETTQGPSTLLGIDGDSDGDGEEDDNDNGNDCDNDSDEGDDEEDRELDSEDDNDDDNDSDEDDDNDSYEDDDEEDREHDSDSENNKLRTYELNRLRYYYAVVVCDSSTTANHLYTTLDGTEFLKTANVFDLQFISDSMEFKHPARDLATEAPPNYKEPDFETRALQHSKVKLTWDDDEPERKKKLRRKFNDDQLDDLGIFLASDDGESDDVDDGDEPRPNGVAKRKLTNKERLALLLEGDKSDEEQTDDQDMEITFNTELEDLSKRILERKTSVKKTVWEMHQEKMKEKRKARKRSSKDDDDDDDSNEDGADEDDDFFEDEKSDEDVKPMKKQKVKAKDKEKGKGKDKLPEEHFEPEATKEELELLVADQDAGNGAKGYNIKRKSKKGKKGKDSVDDKHPHIDLSNDKRFDPMFTSHLFALDPTDPQYKRSADFKRKQAGKKGVHAGTLDSEPPVEESSPVSTLPLDDDASTRKTKRKHDGASTEKLQMLSAVKSLKRNLTAFKKASTSDR